MDCLRDLMATLTNQTLLVMVGSYPRHKRATIPRQTRAPPTISLCHCPQNTTAGRVWLYTLLYGNSLYRLYATAIHPYTSFTPCPGSSVTLYSIYSVYSYTAIHAIQHTAPYSLPQLDTGQTPLTLLTPVSIDTAQTRLRHCSDTPDTSDTQTQQGSTRARGTLLAIGNVQLPGGRR